MTSTAPEIIRSLTPEFMPPGFNQPLIDTLEKIRGKKIIALVNRGNRGDGLIHLGGRRLLSLLDIAHDEIRELDPPREVKGDVLLVYGCGAFGRATHSLVDVTRRIASGFKQIILLPCSIELASRPVKQFVEQFDERYTVFCRERVSFDSLRGSGTRAAAIVLAHDLAFHTDLSAWAKRPHAGRAGLFRTDKEASQGALPRDLPSQDASHGTEREPEKLLDYVARFSEVHTDRCHGAISGALMGRKVHFYRNNYFKNQAIYEHSLVHFPQVTFVRNQSFSARQWVHTMYWGRVRNLEMKVRSVLGQKQKVKT